MPRRLSRGLRLVAIAAAASLVAAQVAVAQIQSDEFNGPINPAVWSFVDPVGDVTLVGDGSAARMSIPGGTSHDLWAGANLAPRLLQLAPNVDLEVEVRFDSSVTSRYQMQGVVFVESADRLLRLEVHHDGQATRLFAAGLVGGSVSVLHNAKVSGSPRYLRVRRTGNEWALGYSLDGTAWTWAPSFTHALTLTAVGPIGANHQNPTSKTPPFSAAVDYFRVLGQGQPPASPPPPPPPPDPPPPPTDSTPPGISAVASSGGSTSVAISWQTDEPAKCQEEQRQEAEAFQAGSHALGVAHLSWERAEEHSDA